MNRCVAAEMLRLCVEKLRNSQLLGALFALIRRISSHHTLDPELIRGSLSEMPSPDAAFQRVSVGQGLTLLLNSVCSVGFASIIAAYESTMR